MGNVNLEKENEKDKEISSLRIGFRTLATIFCVFAGMIVIGMLCYQNGAYGLGHWLFKVVEKIANWIILFVGIPAIFFPLRGKIEDKLLAVILLAFLLAIPVLGYGVTRICENVIESCGQAPISSAHTLWDYLWNILQN